MFKTLKTDVTLYLWVILAFGVCPWLWYTIYSHSGPHLPPASTTQGWWPRCKPKYWINLTNNEAELQKLELHFTERLEKPKDVKEHWTC